MEIFENLWIFFGNILILCLLIHLCLLFVFGLLLGLEILSNFVFKFKEVLNFINDYILPPDSFFDKFFIKFIHFVLIISFIMLVLSMILNKGIFANPFLGILTVS